MQFSPALLTYFTILPGQKYFATALNPILLAKQEQSFENKTYNYYYPSRLQLYCERAKISAYTEVQASQVLCVLAQLIIAPHPH